jgi:hypothetical protein
LRQALHEVGSLQVPGNLKIETLLVKNSGLVDKLRVDGDAVGERAVQALKRVHEPLQTREEVTHLSVAAGAGLAEVPASSHKPYTQNRCHATRNLRLGKSRHLLQKLLLLRGAAILITTAAHFAAQSACLSAIA